MGRDRDHRHHHLESAVQRWPFRHRNMGQSDHVRRVDLPLKEPEMSEESAEEPAEESALGVALYREEWGWRDKEAEQEHHRRVFGQTYREVNGPEHKRCIVLCLDPGQRKPVRCPCCYGKATFRPMREAPPIAPEPGRGERLSAWLGACAAAFWEAVTYPWRVSQQHRVALVRDVLMDAMEAGLTAEVVHVCPECDAHDAAQLAQADTTMTVEVVTGDG
jgi:hypothetical protein